MSDPTGALTAAFAFGVLFAGTIVLLLLNPRSRGVRWVALFQTANMVWLGAQGWALARGSWGGLDELVNGAVHLFPALFIGYALVDGYRRPDRDAWLALAAGVVTLPIALISDPLAGWFRALWHLVGWSTGSFLLYRGHRDEHGDTPVSRRLTMAVVGMLLVVGPISLIGVLLIGSRMWTYAQPLLVVWIQLLIFVGVARLRFYDIEVRARRTGEIAAAAAEQERLAVLGELTATLAHEIRNPLTGVRSLAQRLAEEQVDEPRRRRYAGVILEEVGRVERLVSNLLGIARRAPRDREVAQETPLAPLFDDLALLLSSPASRAHVTLALDAGSTNAPAPREPLAQALLNLLFNAIRHSPEGATVELHAAAAPDGVTLRVRDQGAGIAPEERERIWDPFYTTGRGTGLGLAVVRRLAREHGWEVAVGEAPGGGAEFHIRIPLPARDDPAHEDAPPWTAGAAREALRPLR